jgi:anti-sigma factor RsiW
MELAPDILERLLIDRNVGQLTADAEALLDAYLSANTAGRQLAIEIAATVSLAQRTLASQASRDHAALPPLQVLRQRRAVGGGPVQRYLRAGLLAAACLVAGLGVGRWTLKPEYRTVRVTLSIPATPDAAQTLDDDPGRLLSLQRLYTQAAQVKPRPPADITWSSPLAIPLPRKG